VGEFSKDKAKKGGLCSSCKACKKEYDKKYKQSAEYKASQQKRQQSAEYKASQQKYQQSAERKASLKKYQQSDEGKAYIKQHKANNPLFKLSCNLRGLIGSSLKNKGYRKNTKTQLLLGADFATVSQHLINSAIRNYGAYYPDRDYHIDHIIPCVSAKTESELIALQHYTNLQYLYPEDNLSKNAKLDWKLQA